MAQAQALIVLEGWKCHGWKSSKFSLGPSRSSLSCDLHCQGASTLGEPTVGVGVPERSGRRRQAGVTWPLCAKPAKHSGDTDAPGGPQGLTQVC